MKFPVYGTVSYVSYQYLIWKSLFETAPKNVRKMVKEMQLAKDIWQLDESVVRCFPPASSG
jgi:hypothetical protein